MISLLFIWLGWDLGWRGYPVWSPLAAGGALALGLGLVSLVVGVGAAAALPSFVTTIGGLVAAAAYFGYGVGRLARRAFGGGKRYSLALPQIGR